MGNSWRWNILQGICFFTINLIYTFESNDFSLVLFIELFKSTIVENWKLSWGLLKGQDAQLSGSWKSSLAYCWSVVTTRNDNRTNLLVAFPWSFILNLGPFYNLNINSNSRNVHVFRSTMVLEQQMSIVQRKCFMANAFSFAVWLQPSNTSDTKSKVWSKL